VVYILDSQILKNEETLLTKHFGAISKKEGELLKETIKAPYNKRPFHNF